MPRDEEEIIQLDKALALGKLEKEKSLQNEVKSPLADQIEKKLYEDSLYDDTPTIEDIYKYELNDGLTDAEIEEAIRIAPFIRGVMIVTGLPGSGKDLFANWLAWKIKRYFRNRHVLRDERPRRLFGPYEPFDEKTVAEELNKLNELTSFQVDENMAGNKTRQMQISNLTDKWVTSQGNVKLQGAVLYLTEFWRYMNKRRPFNPMGMFLSGLLNTWRHFDLLVIGTAPFAHQLDRFTCIPLVTTDARCSWCTVRKNTTEVSLYPVAMVGSKGVLSAMGKPLKIWVDGGKPRDCLGGQRYYDLYVSKQAERLTAPSLKIKKVKNNVESI